MTPEVLFLSIKLIRMLSYSPFNRYLSVHQVFRLETNDTLNKCLLIPNSMTFLNGVLILILVPFFPDHSLLHGKIMITKRAHLFIHKLIIII